jgi:tetraacyldisaccharide 4'-kinase
MAARLEAFFLREWQHGSGWQLFLRPISWIYQAIVAARRAMYSAGIYKSHRVAVPVIVVGNITVGGTGKTPVVLALAEYFKRQGARPGIATRGYMRGDMRGPGMVIHVVPDSMTPSSSASLGDEAVLLSQRSGVPVFAGAKRVDVANALLAQFPQTNLVVCDDGLQHYALHRDVEIAVVDASRGFGNAQCLPAGPLREAVSRLDSVDCIILNQTGGAQKAERARELAQTPSLTRANVPVFEMTYGRERMMRVGPNAEALSPLQPTDFVQSTVGKRIVAIAGIGNPQRFFDQLRALGIPLHDTISFPDHHRYAIADIRTIEADLILMTEKDAVKCRELASIDERLWMMQVDAELPEAFYEFVLKKTQHVARPKVT